MNVTPTTPINKPRRAARGTRSERVEIGDLYKMYKSKCLNLSTSQGDHEMTFREKCVLVQGVLAGLSPSIQVVVDATRSECWNVVHGAQRAKAYFDFIENRLPTPCLFVQLGGTMRHRLLTSHFDVTVHEVA
jgi:hypothetical protein